MLSFDITDRNIRVVKGAEASNKIKIHSAATIDIDEELIVNGHIKDIPNVATIINGYRKYLLKPHDFQGTQRSEGETDGNAEDR